MTDEEKRHALLDELVAINDGQESVRRVFANEAIGVLEAMVADARDMERDPKFGIFVAKSSDIRLIPAA